MAYSSKKIISVSEHLYKRLLVAYPASFRQQYGPQMTQVFLDCCHVAYQQDGTRGVLRLWIPTLSDLLANAIAERVSTVIRSLKTQKPLINVQDWPTLQKQGGNMLHITNGD